MSRDGTAVYLGYRLAHETYALYFSTRQPGQSRFSVPQSVFEASAAPWERQVSLTENQLYLVYQDKVDIYLTKRDSVSERFERAARLPEPVNSDLVDSDPFITADGSQLYFSSNRAGSYDIYVAGLRELAPSTGATLVEGVGSDFTYDGSPTLRANGLDLYYQAGKAIVVAHRDDRDSAFSQHRIVDEIDDEGLPLFPERISEDGCSLYFLAKIDGAPTYSIREARKAP